MSRDLRFLALAQLTWGVGEGMSYFFMPLYLQQMGANPARIGGIMGLVGVAMIIAYLPAGYISDRIGRRPLLRLAWVMGSLSTLLLAFGNSLNWVVLGMLLYGLTAFVSVPLNSYTTAARGKLSVGRSLTLLSASFNLGGVAGPLIGGWIAQTYGLQTNFRLALVCFVASTLFIMLLRPQPVAVNAPGEVTPNLRGLLSGRFVGFLGLMFLAMFSMYLSQPLTQNFLQNERGLSISQIGQLIAARGLGVVFLNLTLGQLNARVGFLLGHVGVALFCLLIVYGSGQPVYMLAYFLVGSHMTARNLTFAQVRAITGASTMGLVYGLLETANALAVVLGPPLAGLLYERQPDLVYRVSLGLLAVSLLAASVLSPVRRRHLLEFEQQPPESE